ncbi:restriction endonuclease subunit S [Mycoplasmopsis verecunda]|uniref:Type I restriction modification DNA specificity domain-containing protein n=1 Tax=Mycoplasmopsis verecunda TaxID=171291 RepID=A0A1T4M929_9BACT|nr:restriction endonuclease subunit S [Mycoplasmopsis verecunda]WPB54371.1 restriction endonuclease subunit S [Mycoplasmopsis verecunda]SJZ63204.1 Type I restriction modification DNA specificity domain-containing protein [Mycoplasmopsis verecunda]
MIERERDRVAQSKENALIKILNTDLWKYFKIKDLFTIKTGKDLIYSDIDIDPNKQFFNIISHSTENNGVITQANKLENYDLQQGDTLSLSHIGVLWAFLQYKEYYLGTRTKSLIPKFKSNRYILLFIAVMINKESYRFSYGRVGRDKIPNLKIKLPATIKNGKVLPDFQYMDNFIKSLPYSKYI